MGIIRKEVYGIDLECRNLFTLALRRIIDKLDGKYLHYHIETQDGKVYCLKRGEAAGSLWIEITED